MNYKSNRILVTIKRIEGYLDSVNALLEEVKGRLNMIKEEEENVKGDS